MCGSAPAANLGSASENPIMARQTNLMNQRFYTANDCPAQPRSAMPYDRGLCPLPFLDAGVGVVVVDALEVLGLHLVPGHVGMRVELDPPIAHQVLYETGILVGALRDTLL